MMVRRIVCDPERRSAFLSMEVLLLRVKMAATCQTGSRTVGQIDPGRESGAYKSHGAISQKNAEKRSFGFQLGSSDSEYVNGALLFPTDSGESIASI